MKRRRQELHLDAVLAEVAQTADTLIAQSQEMALEHARMEQTNARLQALVAKLKDARRA